MTSWVYNNFIGLWYHMGYLFRNGFFCIVRRYFQTVNCLTRRRWLYIGGYHRINKIGEFLQFSSKRKGIRAWNFRMMVRKKRRFLWYQNRNNFEKNEKRKDQAPLRPVKWVTMLWFLFGVHPYQRTLDFAFFIIERIIIKRIWCYIKKMSFQKKLGRPLNYNNSTDEKQNGCY